MKKLLLSMILSFCLISFAFAQGKVITGKVTSASGPIPGVSVFVKGSPSTGTQSDATGAFKLTVADDAKIIVFSFIGYKSKELPITGQTINVSLEEENTTLTDVIVVGYGTQNKRDVTGSIARVTADDFKDRPVPTVEGALQGKAPGVFINSGSGKLGQALQIRVRGISSISASNQPLFVIDGVPIVSEALGTYTEADNPLAAISPDDIESMEVLKDAASAAIYGARGSNGVVLITTKKGKQGRTNIDFGYYAGFSDPTKKGDFLNADQYRQLLDASFKYNNYDDGDYANAAEMWKDYTGTDDWTSNNNTNWVNEAFRRGHTQQYNININGGDAKTRFMLSGNYNNNDGIIVNNRYVRTGGRLSIDHTVSKILDVGGAVNISKVDNYRIPTDNAFSNPLQLNALPPIQPVRDASGQLNGSTVYYNSLIDYENGKNLSTTYRTFANAYASLKITPDLVLRSEYGFDFNNLEEEQFLGSKTQDGGSTGGSSTDYMAKSINFNTNNTLNYTKTFNEKHNLNVLAGFAFQDTKFRYSSVTGTTLPSDSFTKIASAAVISAGESSETRHTFVSYLARVNYKYDDKYLLSASIRTDGSSRFGVNNRYGTFPAVSVGWLINQEDGLKSSEWLSLLKLRGSYGLTGNAEIGDFASRNLYRGVNYAGVGGTRPSQLGDPNLSWENTTNYNIGLDFGFFSDRISGTVEYYKKKTTDLLLNAPIAATNGFSSITQNIGDMQNRGFEFSLNTRNFVGEFKWSTSFNISLNRNKVLRLVDDQPIYPGGRFLGRVAVGEPLGYFYGKAYAGVDPANGDALYYIDASRTTTTNDYTLAQNQKLGDPNPKFFGGFGNHFSFKNFDLDVQAQFVSGNDIYNMAGVFQSANGDYFDNQTIDQLNYWTPTNRDTPIPQPRFNEGNGTSPSSRWIQNGSYLRIKSVVFSYNLPKAFINKYKLQNLKIFASALNLFTITGYKGYDPEVNTPSGGSLQSDNIQLGHDFYTPPQARTITFGVNIGL
ncbi:SusC/RagA family TonB-linked outer membrane protein [Pedobacter sp. UBA5917]|jgi:TonB-linked SusC/RagA family outer membrane protein|uniref:SusC/RagA family TonB-linked outer membrane protein n=1 Tax=Pedobacter sp. UBA5917 TaxID=1947061 RepID=UPI0025F7177F|nr:TonB-dependent receptor [Pedobacter sp. UBA5917]